MGGTCGRHGGKKTYLQGFSGERGRKETVSNVCT